MDDSSRRISAVGSDSAVRVFVSYRRDDVPDATDRLALSLKSHLGKDQVFLDVDNIDIGARFAKVVGDWVGRCDVLLAVIGRSWLTATSEEGHRRLEDPRDYVRLEIEAGLNRDIRVVPVLIHGARMPRAAELPDSLVPLLEFHAIELSRAHWDFDVEKLVAALQRLTVKRAEQAAERERVERAAKEHVEATEQKQAAETAFKVEAAKPEAAAPELAAQPAPERAQAGTRDDPIATTKAPVQGSAEPATGNRKRRAVVGRTSRRTTDTKPPPPIGSDREAKPQEQRSPRRVRVVVAAWGTAAILAAFVGLVGGIASLGPNGGAVGVVASLLCLLLAWRAGRRAFRAWRSLSVPERVG